MNFLKRALYKTVAQDSRNMEKIGKFFNWQGLQDEAKQNQDDPSKAIRKAALTAATWYAGGALGGALGGAGGGAAGSGAAAAGANAGTAAGAVAPMVASAPAVASNAGLTAAQIAAKEAALQAAQGGGGLLSESIAPIVTENMAASPLTSGLLETPSATGGGLLGNLSTQVTAKAVPGLSATGPNSQAAMLAAQNSGMGLQGLGMTADAASTAQGLTAGQQALGQGVGLLGRAAPAMNAMPKVMLAMNMMQPQQQPMPMAPPPTPPQVQQGPSAPIYGGMDQPPPGVDPKLWASLDPMMKRRLMGGF